jgi:hypothetical protein
MLTAGTSISLIKVSNPQLLRLIGMDSLAHQVDKKMAVVSVNLTYGQHSAMSDVTWEIHIDRGDSLTNSKQISTSLGWRAESEI